MANVNGTEFDDVLDAAAGVTEGDDAIVCYGGDDLAHGLGGNDNINGNDGDDYLFGDAGGDYLFGGDGDDILVGGADADFLDGGAGIDTASYLFASARVEIYLEDPASNLGEAVGDTYSSVENLVGSLFNDVLTGNAGGNELYGDFGGDMLKGMAGDDSLFGGTGDDFLNGGSGADYLSGGAGLDSADYSSVSAAVVVNLTAPSRNTGEAKGDTYNSIEILFGSNYNDTLTGNASGNELYGDFGDDTLNGMAGNDTIFGFFGNDALNGGVGADQLFGNAGFDRATYIDATAAVTASLNNAAGNTGEAKGDTYGSIEYLTGSNFNDTLTGAADANRISGARGNDVINGLAGDDVIFGGDGNDRIYGHQGKDTLEGNAGNDFFVFHTAPGAANVDTIADFSAAADTIQLDDAVFTALTATGTLAASAFRANTTGLAGDSNDRIIYETDTGKLFYDANGTGAGGGIHFATLTGNPTITNADFVVI